MLSIRYKFMTSISKLNRSALSRALISYLRCEHADSSVHRIRSGNKQEISQRPALNARSAAFLCCSRGVRARARAAARLISNLSLDGAQAGPAGRAARSLWWVHEFYAGRLRAAAIDTTAPAASISRFFRRRRLDAEGAGLEETVLAAD